MFAKLAFVFALATSALAGSVLPATGRTCGTSISDESLVAAERHFAANKVVSNSTERKAAAIPVCLFGAFLGFD